VHALSANASKTEPAKFLAYFVCDHETPLSVDVPQAQTARPPHPPVLRTATGKERATDSAGPSKHPSPSPETPVTNPDRKGGVPTAQRTATGKERATDSAGSSKHPSPSPEAPVTNPDRKGGVPTAQRTATGKESLMALPAARLDEAAHPAPVPERQRRATHASSTERATATRQSLPDPKSISSPTQSRSVSDGLASASSTWSTPTLRDAEAPQ
jgi:hypothetical protein